MRKSTIPVAVVLAASVAPVQAQEAGVVSITQLELLTKCDKAISTVGTYANDVKGTETDGVSYLAQLAKLRGEISLLSTDAAQETLDEYSGKIDTILTAAEAKEKEYAKAYYELLTAIETEGTKKTAAQTTIDGLSALVQSTYQTQLDGITPSSYTEEDLETFHNDPTKAEEALGKVKNNIESYQNIIEKAPAEDQNAKDAQDALKTELLSSIATAKEAAETALETVECYINYADDDENATKISGAISAYEEIKADVETAAANNTLTDKTAYETRIIAQKNNVSDATTAAETAAKAAAKEYSDNAVSGLTKYTLSSEGDDENTIAKKQAANAAIDAAIDKAAKGHDIISKGSARTTFEGELTTAIDAAKDAISAVTLAENNYKAYKAANTYIEGLQNAYNDVAIQLSSLKVEDKINPDIYNDANNRLNEVAETIAKMKEDNQDNYDGDKYKKPVEGDDVDELYAELTGRLNTGTINAILTDATAANGNYNALTAALATAKTSAGEVANKTMQGELETEYNNAKAAIDAYAKAATDENKTAADEALDAYKTAIATAKADLQAYNDALKMIGDWQKDLDSVVLPNLGEDSDYPDKQEIIDLNTENGTLDGQLTSANTTVENSFNASPRTCQGALSDLETGTLRSQVSTWKSEAQTALDNYNKWYGEQSDETLYNEATSRVANLQAELDAAIAATASTAKGYAGNQTAINELKTEIDRHNTETGHTTGCVSSFPDWEKKIDEISASIEANKKAYEADLTEYNSLKGTLSSLKNDSYYIALTDKSEVDTKIDEAQTALDGYKSAQTVVANKTSVENSITAIKDLIASKYLLQVAGEVETSLATVKATIEGDATLNPDNHYSNILTEYETTLTGLKTSYSTAKYSEITTKKAELDTLKSNIEKVVPDAQENYQKYQAQLATQKKNKADWAIIYSEVGALYSGEQFAGAQALYQGQLNDCLKVINDYDAEIESKYKSGESAKFATEDYNTKIAENKEAMEDISKAARDNRTTYDSQTDRVETLNTSYKNAVDAIQAKIDDVTAKIAAAEEGTDTSDLTDKKTSLETLKTDLTAIKTRIDALDTTVGEKVNEGMSVEYDDTFSQEFSDIQQDISDILSSANGTYNEAISAHNKIVIENFRAEYAKAKTLYNDVVYAISKYASYEHALDAEGNSAYAAAIQTANEGLFPIIEELKAISKTAESGYANANGSYFDTTQENKQDVEDREATINGILAAFLNETQTIANNNGYAADITALSTKYHGIVSAIDGYTYKEAAKTAFEAIEGGKASAVVDAYVAAKAENKGPQVIDDLKLKIVTDNADTNLDKAYNEAAKAEADGHITAAKAEIAANPKSAYPLSATWETTIANANAKVNAAQAALDASYAAGTVPADLTTILGNLDGINTMFEDVKATAEAEQKAEEAEQAITDQYDKYEGQIAMIADGDEEEDIKGINDYKAPYEYADKLTDLLADGDDAVAAAREANELAKTFGYKDDAQIEIGTVKVNKWRSIVSGKVYTQEEYNKLERLEKYFCQPISVDEPVYYAGTAKQYVEEKIAAAQSVLDQIKDKVAELEANDLRLIVNNLKDEVETLIPLYNRAVANGGDEAALAGIYTDIETLRTSVTITASTPEKDIERMASEDNQKSVREQIESLKQRIEAQDAEYQTYASLMEALDGVKTQLAEAQAKIDAAGDFTADLETAFATDKANIQNAIAKAEKDLNADHANNLCGKEGAKVTETTVSNIAADITTLSENIDTKLAELQTAAQDAATLAANNAAFDSANAALNALYQTLQDAVDEIETLAVQTSYIEREDAIEDEIDAAISSLETARDEANGGEHPTALDTSAAQQATETINGKISTLLSDARQAQADYESSLEALQERISALETTISGIEISEIAAANEEVIQAQQELDAVKQKIDDKMAAVNPYVIEDINTLVADAEQKAAALATLAEEKTYVPGDIDGDGTVNVLDLSLISDLVSGRKDGADLDEKTAKAADMDGDGEYTVADLVQINNLYVYGNKRGPVAAGAKGTQETEAGSVDMTVNTDNMDVQLNGSAQYAAIQMDVQLPDGVSIREVEFAGETKNVIVSANVLRNGSCRIMLYSVNSAAMLSGEGNLLNLKLAGEGSGIVSIDNIIASTGDGQRQNLRALTGAHTIVTGINAVEASEEDSSVFGVNGIVRKTLQKGINIVRDAAGKVRKISVK